MRRWRENLVAMLPGGKRAYEGVPYYREMYDAQYESGQRWAKYIANGIEEYDGEMVMVARQESPEERDRLKSADYRVLLDKQRELREAHSLELNYQEGTGFTERIYAVETRYGNVNNADAYFMPERIMSKEEFAKYISEVLTEQDPEERERKVRPHLQEMERLMRPIREVMDCLPSTALEALRSFIVWNEDNLTGRRLNALRQAGFLSEKHYTEIQAANKDPERRVLGGAIMGYHRSGEERDEIEYRAIGGMEKKGNMPMFQDISSGAEIGYI